VRLARTEGFDRAAVDMVDLRALDQ
jgi:hypothetical protein